MRGSVAQASLRCRSSTHEFGPFLALGVAFILLISLTFVPAAVILFGRAAFWPMKRVQRDPGERSPWGPVVALVARRPAAVTAGSVVLLAALAARVFAYTPNANLISDLRGDTDSLRGQRLLCDAFPKGQLAPTTVLVQAPDPGAAAATVGEAIPGIDGVSQVGTPVISADGTARGTSATSRWSRSRWRCSSSRC